MVKSSKGKEAKDKRRCRDYRLRTLGTVRRAVEAWCLIFGHPLSLVDPFLRDLESYDCGVGECSKLASQVKKFLADTVTGVSPEESLSFLSIKKILPDACACQEEGLLGRLVSSMVKDDIVLPTGYLSFVRKVAEGLFPVGWDSTYRSHCYSVSPPLKACLEAPCSVGGAFSDVPFSQSEFLDAVLLGKLGSDRSRAILGVVQSAGKPRALASFSSDSLVLKPLHKALYDRLSTRRWLLRGELEPSALDKAGFNRRLGGVLTSGDYKSATDNLPQCVARAILEVALRNSQNVPESISEYALRSLRPYVNCDTASSQPRSGRNLALDRLSGSVGRMEDYDWFEMRSSQQMGSLLSFPLLCAQNYVAFRYACFRLRRKSRDIPVLINGDDILFQSCPEFSEGWMGVVRELGLEVEQSKTSVEEEWGSLNSSLLRWSEERLRKVDTLRFGYLRRVDLPHGLSDSFFKFVFRSGLSSEGRWWAARQFFSWHRPLLEKTGLSLGELGFQGRLAFRAARLEGVCWKRTKLRVVFGDALAERLPPPPDLHNIVLSDDVVEVPSLSEEEELVFRLEVVSRKWGLVGKFKRESRLLGFWLSLSKVQPQRPGDSFYFGGLSGDLFLQPIVPGYHFLSYESSSLDPVGLGCTSDWWSRYYRLYREYPRPVREGVLFYDYLDRLPTYAEVGVEFDEDSKLKCDSRVPLPPGPKVWSACGCWGEHSLKCRHFDPFEYVPWGVDAQ
jgi:hypothetical protein